MVRVKAVDMKTPWVIRRAVKAVRSGAKASATVGMANSARLVQTPVRRGMRWPKRAAARPATAMPMVPALTAKPMAAGATR
jgi:hypothetical protein